MKISKKTVVMGGNIWGINHPNSILNTAILVFLLFPLPTWTPLMPFSRKTEAKEPCTQRSLTPDQKNSWANRESAQRSHWCPSSDRSSSHASLPAGRPQTPRSRKRRSKHPASPSLHLAKQGLRTWSHETPEEGWTVYPKCCWFWKTNRLQKWLSVRNLSGILNNTIL